VRITQGNKHDAMVGQSADRVHDGHLLSSSRSASGNKEACIFASKSTGGPKRTSGIPERLPLRRHIPVTSGDTEDEGIVSLQNIGSHNRVVRFGWSVHRCEDFLRESLGHLVDGGSSTSRLDARLDRLS